MNKWKEKLLYEVLSMDEMLNLGVLFTAKMIIRSELSGLTNVKKQLL